MTTTPSGKKLPAKPQPLAPLHKPAARAVGGDALTNTRLKFAVADLERSGTLSGARSHKLSARVDPGLLAAARRRTGLRSDSDLVNAALAVVAAGDDFGAWLVTQAGRLPEDFELAL